MAMPIMDAAPPLHGSMAINKVFPKIDAGVCRMPSSENAGAVISRGNRYSCVWICSPST